MPMHDIICDNEHEQYDVMLKVGHRPSCLECGAPTKTLWRGKAACVIGDDIPGGIWIRHGICNEDGSPKKYYSHTEMRAEAARRGVQNHVEHVTVKGTDRSLQTTRWI